MYRKKAKADYDYEVVTKPGFVILVIEDKDLGNRSVTNDIENVVKDIINEVETAGYLDSGVELKYETVEVVYRDSDGTWNGWNSIATYYPFQCQEIETILKENFNP